VGRLNDFTATYESYVEYPVTGLVGHGMTREAGRKGSARLSCRSIHGEQTGEGPAIRTILGVGDGT
jgi:hypothetical protein